MPTAQPVAARCSRASTLVGTAEPGQKDVRAAERDRSAIAELFSGGEIAVERAARSARPDNVRATRRLPLGAPCAPPKKNRRTSRLRARTRGERLDQLDAGHALAQRPAVQARRKQDPDRVAQRSAARLTVSRKRHSRCACTTISVPSVTTSDGSAPRASSTMRSTASSRPTASTRQPRISIDVTPAPERREQRLQPQPSASGIAPSGERHAPT